MSNLQAIQCDFPVKLGENEDKASDVTLTARLAEIRANLAAGELDPVDLPMIDTVLALFAQRLIRLPEISETVFS